MPERWERELRKLQGVEPREHAIRERADRGPSWARRPSRRDGLIAGIVAGAVTIGGVAVLWQLNANRSTGETGGATADLPTLLVTFESKGMIVDQMDATVHRIDTTIVYGDAREEDFTSTISEGAHVDWVAVDDLTHFVPGPTAGSPVRIEADGEDARVLIGDPADWPEFERFTPIDALPNEPGEYVLLFEAGYPEGTARTARSVRIVAPGGLQLLATGGHALDTATAVVYADGRRSDGFLSASWYTEGDFGVQTEPRVPMFADDEWVTLPPGPAIELVSNVTEARAGLLQTYSEADHTSTLPLDLLQGPHNLARPDGRYLLAVDVTWIQVAPGPGDFTTEERAFFYFPIEIVIPSGASRSPAPQESASPAPTSAGSVVIDIRRTSEETGDPEAHARLGGQDVWMCPNGWSLVTEDGTTESTVFDCGQEENFVAPTGTPIVVAGDFDSVDVIARVSANGTRPAADEVPALEAGTVVTLTYDVTWADGSEASFWLLLTVGEDEPSGSSGPAQIVVNVYGVGERSDEMPIATFSFAGETKTACTQDFEWTFQDGTTASGPEQSNLPECTGRAIEVPPGASIAIQAASTTRVFTTRATTQFFEGDVGLVVSAEWPNGNATFVVPLTVASRTPDLELVVLDCPDQVEFPAPTGPRIEPAGSAYIVGNLSGFEDEDIVEQMTRNDEGTDPLAGVWQVVRDGSVVASVDYPELSGMACDGAGIGGT